MSRLRHRTVDRAVRHGLDRPLTPHLTARVWPFTFRARREALTRHLRSLSHRKRGLVLAQLRRDVVRLEDLVVDDP